MTDLATVPPPKRRRWLWVLLIASIALNALLAGAILRSLWHMRANIALTGAGLDTSLPAFVNTLPADRRADLNRSAVPDRPGMLRPLRQEVRRARSEAARLFVAEPFDKKAFIAAQEQLFEAESRLRMSVQRILPELGERMTTAERRAYLAWRSHYGLGGGRRGQGGGRGGDRSGDDSGPPWRRP